MCAGTWAAMDRQIIIRDTKAALIASFGEPGKIIPVYTDEDLTIYNRCAEDTLMSHTDFGNLGFSFLKYIPAHIKRIHFQGHPVHCFICLKLEEAMKARINKLRPNIEIFKVRHGDIDEDFAKLSFSKNVLVASFGSSFVLWSLLGSEANVWSPNFYGGYWSEVNSHEIIGDHFGPKWHWMHDVPKLTAKMAADLGFNSPTLDREFCRKLEKDQTRTAKIIDWFEQN